MPEIIGLILAAGRGTRFDPTGRRNKLLAALPDGRTVLRASCANLLPWVDRMVVVTGAHGAPLRAALDAQQFSKAFLRELPGVRKIGRGGMGVVGGGRDAG